MFSENAKNSIEKLRFDSSARFNYCIIPLGSIYWDDELPPPAVFPAFVEESDRNLVLKLFSIRISYWNSSEISESDLRLFDDARKMFPNWPIFQRLELDSKSRAAHEETQNEVLDFFAELSEHANDLSVDTGAHGITTISANFDLRDNWLRVQDVELDRERKTVKRADMEIESLTPSEFAVLEFLMENADQVITPEMLSEVIETSCDVVWSLVKRVRNKLSKDKYAFIQTVYGKGYMVASSPSKTKTSIEPE